MSVFYVWQAIVIDFIRVQYKKPFFILHSHRESTCSQANVNIILRAFLFASDNSGRAFADVLFNLVHDSLDGLVVECFLIALEGEVHCV